MRKRPSVTRTEHALADYRRWFDTDLVEVRSPDRENIDGPLCARSICTAGSVAAKCERAAVTRRSGVFGSQPSSPEQFGQQNRVEVHVDQQRQTT